MGYDSPPWTFKGRALYQLQLVPVSEARKHVPEQFKLVELFGHTLGGFFLARYDDSPAGAFDELVALAGLVWNSPPVVCMGCKSLCQQQGSHGPWAPPSPWAPGSSSSNKSSSSSSSNKSSSSRHSSSWWGPTAAPPDRSAQAPLLRPGRAQALQIASIDIHPRSRGVALPVASFLLPPAKHHMAPFGPRLTLFLPSFSGNTLHVPELLKYSCKLETNLRLTSSALSHTFGGASVGRRPPPHVHHGDRELLGAVFGGRPLLAMAFDNMVMQVQEPTPLALPVGGPGSSQGKSWGQAKLASMSQSLLTLIPVTHLPCTLRV
ncbi:MAG: hypothetical protein WDW36_005870 [Sanguina aurantia]